METAPIGHNSGESTLYVSARADAIDALTPRQVRLQEILEALRKTDIKNRGDASLTVDRIGIAKDFSKLVLEDRDRTREPYAKAKETVEAVFFNFIQPLLEEIEAATQKLNFYHEEFRRKAQEQKRANAVELPAVEAKAKPAPIRGDFGKKLVSRERRIATLENIAEVPEWIMNTKAVREALEKVATSALAQHDSIPGFTVSTTTKGNVQ